MDDVTKPHDDLIRELTALREQVAALQRTEQSLREAEASFRAIVENVPDIVYTFDRDLRCTYVNRPIKPFSGIGVRPVGGRADRGLATRGAPGRTWEEPLRRVFQTGRPETLELESPTPDGPRLFQCRIAPRRDQEGSVASVVVIARDTTNRRQSEEVLRTACDDLDRQVRERTATLLETIEQLQGEVQERRRTEKALHASEERFRLMFEHMVSGVAVYEAVDEGEDFVFKEFNPAAERITKLPRADVLGRRVSRAFPYVSEFGLLEVFQRVWRTGIPEQHPARRYRDDRLTFWAENYVFKLPSGEIAAIFDDVTDRKQADEDLRESEERLASVIDTSPDAIVLMDLTGRILLCNRGGALMAGFDTAEELVSGGVSAFDLLIPEDRERAREGIRELLEEGILRQNEEYCLLRRDGSRCPVELNSSLRRDPQGNPLDLVLVVRDVTERHQAEAALRQSEALYRSLVENIDVGITLIDPDHTIVTVNPALARMFGRTVADFRGRKCFREFERREALCPHCPGEKATATGQTADVESETVRPDGSPITVRLRAVPLFAPDGAPTGFVELVEDVTEQKRNRQLLEQAKEAAEAANRAKSAFLANMSHEIRTPMTAILGFADLLMSPSLSREEQRQFLETIQRNGQALLGLLNDILDISRIEADKLTLEKTDCPLGQLVDDVLSIVQVHADEKRLSLEVRYEHPLPERIYTDRHRLRQILANLVGNAIKFTDRGWVRLTARCQTEADGHARVEFAVSDSGIGIQADKIAELFQPFMQVDMSATRRHGGTGLGLTISKRLAAALGGDIAVVSRWGEGSTFTLSIDGGSLKDVPMRQAE